MIIPETRSNKSIINAKIGAVCYMLSLFVSFFSRSFFLEHLGTEFLGMMSSITSIIGFLNVSELGIGAAISIVLYKPLFLHDRFEICRIVSVLGYLYRRVGMVMVLAGLLIGVLLPFIFPTVSVPTTTLYLAFIVLLSNSLIGFFFNYQSVLLSADQRNYLVVGFLQLTNITKVILQIFSLYQFDSVTLYLLLEIVSGVVYAFILHHTINRNYSWLSCSVSDGKRYLQHYLSIKQNLRRVIVHRIGGFVQNQSSALFIYAFVSLPTVALYYNYQLVCGSLSTFMQSVFGSTEASIGNLVAEGHQTKVFLVYKELLAFRFFCAGIVAGCIYYLLPPFISIWLGPQYLLSDFVNISLSIVFFLRIVRDVTDQFILAYGLLADIWSPVVETVVFILASSLGGYYWGLEGVLLGPMVSLLGVIYLWKPYYLFSRGFHISIVHYIIVFIRYLLLLITPFVVSLSFISLIRVFSDVPSWSDWIEQAVCFTMLYGSMTLLFFYTSSTDFRSIIRRLFSIIFRNEKS